MSEVALIGAGGSACTFLRTFQIEQFELFTSSGTGELNGIQAKPLSELHQNQFSKIYILIYALHEVIDYINFGEDCENLFWFDALEGQVYPVTDPYGESIAEAKGPIRRPLAVLYDLRVEPLTYDFVVFLVDSEMERRKQGLDSISLILAPGDYGGYNKEWRVESEIEKKYRLHNLLIPALQLLTCEVNFHFCATRAEARILWQGMQNRFPEYHDFLNPQQRHRYHLVKQRIQNGQNPYVFRAKIEPYRKQVQTWLKENNIDAEKMITITLRETFRGTARNSNVREWYKLADELNNRGYQIVFVRDVNKCFEPLDYKGKHHVFNGPCLNVVLRKELYQLSYANLLTSNGVAILNFFHRDIRYLVVGMVNNAYPECTEEAIKKLGFSRQSIIGAMPWQRVSWENDSFENLQYEFNKLEKIINEHF